MAKIVTIIGARPQFIKAAPVSAAFSADSDIEELIVHTGQHFDANMSDIFFRELKLKAPAYNLGVHGGNHGEMTAKMLAGIEEVLLREKPDAVLVYGDTNSTLAGALAAAKLSIPVVHVEAGLRSFNRRMPEEINRVLVDHLGAVLFCPTSAAVKNLSREGIDKGVHPVGDIMFDTMLSALPIAEGHSKIMEQLELSPRDYAVATIHRAENTGSKAVLEKVVRYLAKEAQARKIVWPVHPRTRQTAERFGVDLAASGILLCEPLGFLDMCRLLHHAAVLYTDSGGMQKEAYFHRVPCVTLRSETEWIETIEHGWNRLWTEPDYRPRSGITEYGDGHATEKMLKIIKTQFAH